MAETTDAMVSAISGSAAVDGITLSHQFTRSMRRQIYPAISPSNKNNSMEGKNVLITGATRGIGKAVALAWAQAGASGIVITGRARDLLAAVSAEINKISPKTKVLALTSEATSEAGTKELWAQVKSEIGIIDVLICNAGVFSEKGSFPKTGKIPPSQWWSDMEVNVRGPYLQIHNFLQQHIVESKEPSGTIIILSSNGAAATIPGVSAYCISKLIGIRMAEFLHVEHPQVRSFAVHPGMVPTQMALDSLATQSIDPPEMTGGLSLYLSTPRADFLRGRYLTVNWDVEEMEQHSSEIQRKRLLTTTFINAQLGPEGHPFEGVKGSA